MRPCSGPWKSPVIHWDGRLSVCCRDLEGGLSPGNINENTFDELWFGEKMDHLRMRHVEGRLSDVPVCKDCPGQAVPIITDNEIVEFLRATGRENKISEYLDRVNKLK